MCREGVRLEAPPARAQHAGGEGEEGFSPLSTSICTLLQIAAHHQSCSEPHVTHIDGTLLIKLFSGLFYHTRGEKAVSCMADAPEGA